jgi:glyoxylase-like metal-dependent hydrolase (beta-lactamase superfamily II)
MSRNFNKSKDTIQAIDLNFQGTPGAIAVYVIPYAHGVVLVETGPGSTIPALKEGLKTLGLDVSDITDVLLTHIHLDHAGAAGWLAQQGARIHVHAKGAPHMANPEKLLASATRIYGERMDELWGDFLAVPKDLLSIVGDGDVIEVDGLQFTVLDTPGHANHHNAYIFQDVCFTGDVGGVRLSDAQFIRLPMPPPEFELETWRDSLAKLRKEFARGKFQRIAPTHFGIYDDPEWHLSELDNTLDETEQWIVQVMSTNPSIEELREKFLAWNQLRAQEKGLRPNTLNAFEIANPSGMSAFGIYRYWHKVRNKSNDIGTTNSNSR